MKENLLFLLGILAVAALVGALSHSSLSPTVRTALSTVIIAVIIAPFVSMISNIGQVEIPEISVGEGNYDGYIEVGEGAFCEGIALAVAKEFSLSLGEVRVECVDFDFSQMRAKKINISLSGEGLFADYRLICRYVEDNFTSGGRCYIDELRE